MFDKHGKLDARSQRILREQMIPPRFGSSPGMDAITVGYPLGIVCEQCELVAMVALGIIEGPAHCDKHGK
jgi:hypothetical protein